MESLAYELNYSSARLARAACDEATAADPSRPRFVVGAIGPTNRTGSDQGLRLSAWHGSEAFCVAEVYRPRMC